MNLKETIKQNLEEEVAVKVTGLNINGYKVVLEEEKTDYQFLFERAAIALEKNGLWEDFCETYNLDY